MRLGVRNGWRDVFLPPATEEKDDGSTEQSEKDQEADDNAGNGASA